jgi:hypothetical protein
VGWPNVVLNPFWFTTVLLSAAHVLRCNASLANYRL